VSAGGRSIDVGAGGNSSESIGFIVFAFFFLDDDESCAEDWCNCVGLTRPYDLIESGVLNAAIPDREASSMRSSMVIPSERRQISMVVGENDGTVGESDVDVRTLNRETEYTLSLGSGVLKAYENVLPDWAV
jgi:hypothetical protein